MFNIRLYSFSKRVNSTKVPNVSGYNFSCTIKDVSSILNPVVEIRTSNYNDIQNCNYAYIQSFGRYYFIDDMTWSIGTWSISMHVDVLASFISDIKLSKQYVLRSSIKYNKYIPDSLYMTKMSQSAPQKVVYGSNYVDVKSITGGLDSTQQYFKVNFNQGYFVVAMVGNNTSGMSYYCFTNAGFQDFIDKVTTFKPSTMTDYDRATANAIWNPMQYITSVRWFPIEPSGLPGSATRNISIGGENLSLNIGGYAMSNIHVDRCRVQLTLPKHPKYNDFPFMNMTPYTEATLVFQPFGTFPLDTTKLWNDQGITVEWFIDYCGGSCVLNIWGEYLASTQDGTDLLYTQTSDAGVLVPISSMMLDWKAGLAVSALSYIGNKIAGATAGLSDAELAEKQAKLDQAHHYQGTSSVYQVAEQNQALFDKATDFVSHSMGQLITQGAPNSFLGYMMDPPMVLMWFHETVEEDNDRYGRPLYMKTQLLNVWGGFCMCSNASVDFTKTIKPTINESNAICAALNAGVFLE